MVETVILHIGGHKTGSSSIQESLAGYDDSETFYATFDNPNHSVPMLVLFAKDYKKYAALVFRGYSEEKIALEKSNYRAELTQMLERKDRRRLIISGESISNLMDDEKIALIEFLGSPGREIQLVYYVREPSQFAASVFQQKVSNGLRELPPKLSPKFSYRLSGFMSALPKDNITVRQFDRKTLTGGCVVQDFCDYAGIKLEEDRVVTANIGMSASAVKLLYLFNRSGILSQREDFLFRARQRFTYLIKKAYTDGSKFTPGLFQSISDYADLDFLNSEFGIRFSEIPTPDNTVKMGKEIGDISSIDIDPLDNLLQEFRVDHRLFKTPAHKLHRLYYAVMNEDHLLQASHNKILSNQDINLLRDLALRIFQGSGTFRIFQKSVASASDAYDLMNIAHRARPEGEFIKQKLDEIAASIKK